MLTGPQRGRLEELDKKALLPNHNMHDCMYDLRPFFFRLCRTSITKSLKRLKEYINTHEYSPVFEHLCIWRPAMAVKAELVPEIVAEGRPN